MSRGAQVHHFPTKTILVAEALKRLASRREQEIRDQLERLPRGARRIDAMLDLLWVSHAGPLFQAAMELWVAAMQLDRLTMQRRWRSVRARLRVMFESG